MVAAMKLNRVITAPTADAADAPPVLLVHGLLGSLRNLGGIARQLTDRTVIQVDMRNHGDSGWDEDSGYPAMAGDLAEAIADAGGTADVVGHSMGGKAAMVLALTRPELVRRLVVMDIAPLAYSHTQAHQIAALKATPLDGLDRRSAADARLAERVEDPGNRAFFLQSLDLKAEGGPRWKMNLDALGAGMDQLVGWPDGLQPGVFAGPVLALAGEESDYVGHAGEAALRRYFPQAELRGVEGAGHWLHADKPAEVGQMVNAFLNAA